MVGPSLGPGHACQICLRSDPDLKQRGRCESDMGQKILHTNLGKNQDGLLYVLVDMQLAVKLEHLYVTGYDMNYIGIYIQLNL